MDDNNNKSFRVILVVIAGLFTLIAVLFSTITVISMSDRKEYRKADMEFKKDMIEAFRLQGLITTELGIEADKILIYRDEILIPAMERVDEYGRRIILLEKWADVQDEKWRHLKN